MAAHRFAYLNYVGDVSEDLMIDHKCKNPACVNPAHLEAVMKRGALPDAPAAVHDGNGSTTQCITGHPVDAANVILSKRNGSGALVSVGKETPVKSAGSKFLMVVPWALFAGTLGLAFAFYLVAEERERHYVERLKVAVARQEFLRETIYVLEPNKLKTHDAMLKAHNALKKNDKEGPPRQVAQGETR